MCAISVRDHDMVEEHRDSVNNCADETIKKTDPVYEEIFDQQNSKKKLGAQSEVKGAQYENLHEISDDKAKLNNHAENRRPITPSAPVEEDFGNLIRTAAVPNEYGALGNSLVRKAAADGHVTSVQGDTDSVSVQDHTDVHKCASDCQNNEETIELDRQGVAGNTYSQFDNIIPLEAVASQNTEILACTDSTENEPGQLCFVVKNTEVTKKESLTPLTDSAQHDESSSNCKRNVVTSVDQNNSETQCSVHIKLCEKESQGKDTSYNTSELSQPVNNIQRPNSSDVSKTSSHDALEITDSDESKTDNLEDLSVYDSSLITFSGDGVNHFETEAANVVKNEIPPVKMDAISDSCLNPT